MKTMAVLIGTLAVCFLLGVGLQIVSPTDAVAGESNCCNAPPSIPVCGSDPTQECEPYELSQYWRCYLSKPLCEDYNCECWSVGCGEQCIST